MDRISANGIVRVVACSVASSIIGGFTTHQYMLRSTSENLASRSKHTKVCLTTVIEKVGDPQTPDMPDQKLVIKNNMIMRKRDFDKLPEKLSEWWDYDTEELREREILQYVEASELSRSLSVGGYAESFSGEEFEVYGRVNYDEGECSEHSYLE